MLPWDWLDAQGEGILPFMWLAAFIVLMVLYLQCSSCKGGGAHGGLGTCTVPTQQYGSYTTEGFDRWILACEFCSCTDACQAAGNMECKTGDWKAPEGGDFNTATNMALTVGLATGQTFACSDTPTDRDFPVIVPGSVPNTCLPTAGDCYGPVTASGADCSSVAVTGERRLCLCTPQTERTTLCVPS